MNTWRLVNRLNCNYKIARLHIIYDRGMTIKEKMKKLDDMFFCVCKLQRKMIPDIRWYKGLYRIKMIEVGIQYTDEEGKRRITNSLVEALENIDMGGNAKTGYRKIKKGEQFTTLTRLCWKVRKSKGIS